MDPGPAPDHEIRPARAEPTRAVSASFAAPAKFGRLAATAGVKSASGNKAQIPMPLDATPVCARPRRP